MPVCALTEIEKYTDAEAAADRVVEIFDDLPWRYTFSLKLPAFPSSVFEEGADRYQLSDTLCLVKPSDNLVQEYPLQSGIEGSDKCLFGKGLLSIFFAEEWDSKAVYLQTITDGFVGKNISTETNENVVSLLRAFCGLSIALRLTRVEHSFHPGSPKMRFYVHRHVDGRWVIDDTEEVSEEVSKTISDLVLHDLDGQLDSARKRGPGC